MKSSPVRSGTRQSRTLAGALVLLILAVAPFALAQKKPKPKKGAKPAASASASASDSADAPAPAPEPTPAPTPEPAPEASASASATPKMTAAADTEPEVHSTDTREDPGKRYYFVGLRYRGTVIPKFLLNAFVSEGATIYSNTIGAELDIRKDGQSIIPWISYTSYGTGDILFLQKGENAQDAGFYSVVNSGLKAIYIGLDEVWSTPIANHLDFEYGFGVGLGVILGSLQNNWVFQDPNGSLKASNGLSFSECQNASTQPGCNLGDHQNATVRKVGGYTEPNWFNGGAVPVLFPHFAPQLGLRFKPIKQMEARLGLGISLTGLWFGLSADYGLEKTEGHGGGDDAKPADTTKKDGDKSSFGLRTGRTL